MALEKGQESVGIAVRQRFVTVWSHNVVRGIWLMGLMQRRPQEQRRCKSGVWSRLLRLSVVKAQSSVNGASIKHHKMIKKMKWFPNTPHVHTPLVVDQGTRSQPGHRPRLALRFALDVLKAYTCFSFSFF